MSVLCILRFPHIDTLETYTANNTEWFRTESQLLLLRLQYGSSTKREGTSL